MLAALLSDTIDPRRAFAPAGDLHLNFLDNLHYWNGRERFPADFTTFYGGIRTARGLLINGNLADIDITVDWSTVGISAPFSLIASYTPHDVSNTSRVVAAVDDLTTNNRAQVGHTTTSALALINRRQSRRRTCRPLLRPQSILD